MNKKPDALEQITNIIKRVRQETKTSYNGTAIFIHYPISSEQLAEEAHQLFEPLIQQARQETAREIFDWFDNHRYLATFDAWQSKCWGISDADLEEGKSKYLSKPEKEGDKNGS